MKILLLLFIVFILFPIIRFAFNVWRSVRTVKKAFRQQYEQQQQQYQSQQQDDYQSDPIDQQRKKRAIEYLKKTSEDAEFETISSPRTTSSQSSSQSSSSSSAPRYTDAQFEDIK